jgi:carotenoid cleavage dioxygenase-like enzyme
MAFREELLGGHGPWSAPPRPGRLSYLASRTVTREGAWTPRAVEGEIPRALNGALYRNGPGQKETFGVPLDHLFDGDAYVTALRFADGGLTGLSRFLPTEERVHEQKYQQMRYHEFGTRCRERPLGFKNPPSINVFPMADGYYALSEGAKPVQIDPDTLDCRSARDFAASWPARTTFTAHPKRDPVSGDVFAYGLTMALFPELVLARLPAGATEFETFARVRLGGFYPVHDFMLTENYALVALPPVRVNMWGMLRGRSSVADNLVVDHDKPLRILIARKDGQGAPTLIETPSAGMIFHHANAVESEDGAKIRLVSMETEALAGFRLLEGWGRAAGLAQPKSHMVEFVIDLADKTVTRDVLTDGAPIEFPAIDNRQLGRRMDAVYALRTFDAPDDPLAFDALTSWSGGRFREARAGRGQMFGEPVALVDETGALWLAHLGYDGDNDETFLDLREPEELRRVARVWLGLRIPLGFHGLWVAGGEAQPSR